MPTPNTLHHLFVPAQAVGANLVYFDFWNGSGVPVFVPSLRIVKDNSVALAGSVSVKLHLTRTSAIGVAGTAAVADGATLTVPALTSAAPWNTILAGVSARITPTSGATAGAIIRERHVMSNEAFNQDYSPSQPDFVRDDGGLIIPSGTGIRVVQGSVASVGNIGFDMPFEFKF